MDQQNATRDDPPLPTAGPGRAGLWSSDRWRATAVSWMDAELARVGAMRTGEAEQPRIRPWATVLRAPTTIGPVWLKASAEDTAFEVGVYDVLVHVAPHAVLTPIASDRRRGWLLLPDAGPTLRDRARGSNLVAGFATALERYGALQRSLTDHVPALLATGVPDMRPAVMPRRFDEALEATTTALATPRDRAVHRRATTLRSTFVAWCARLDAGGPAASLDHNDLHTGSVLAGNDGGTRFLDWGDSVVAHPFAALLVPLQLTAALLRTDPGDPRVQRVRDAYLAGFGAVDGRRDVDATLDVAVRVARVARVLTWERALRSARRAGDPVADDWARGPLEALSAFVEDVRR